jgi:ribonuclease HI
LFVFVDSQEIRNRWTAAEETLKIKILLQWCPGHSNVPWNEEVDQLADRAATKAKHDLRKKAKALMAATPSVVLPPS